MAFTTTYMIALANDGANPLLTSPRGGVGHNDDRTHHGIRLRILHTIASKLQATPHIHLINLLLIHAAKLSKIRGLSKFYGIDV
jgi:hypothetical protein